MPSKYKYSSGRLRLFLDPAKTRLDGTLANIKEQPEPLRSLGYKDDLGG